MDKDNTNLKNLGFSFPYIFILVNQIPFFPILIHHLWYNLFTLTIKPILEFINNIKNKR